MDHTQLHKCRRGPYTFEVAPSFDPFSAKGPAEVPLERAPLARVIAQLRFPPIVSLGRPEFIGPFQEAIRPRYPILRNEQMAGFLVGPGGSLLAQEQTVWRFHDKADGWRVSLASNFLAIESTVYKDRDDFFKRFDDILVALDAVAKLTVYDRLGMRYINRVSGTELERLPSLVRPEVLGVGASSVMGMNHTLTETLFKKDNVSLNARWGRLPEGATTDPALLSPIGEPSWVLDLDMFHEGQKDFVCSEVVEEGLTFARTIHNFFRWCVKDEFLAAYGGEP